MIHTYVLSWPDCNLETEKQLREIKADSIILNFLIDGLDLTDWKVRCEVYDLNTSIKLANTLSGGNDNEIQMLTGPSAMGKFQIKVPAGSTGTFQQYGQIEVEIQDPDGNIYTIFQQEIWFVNQRIIWSNPNGQGAY